MKYEHEETRSASSNALLHYSYHESEVTHYTTPEGEKCISGSCAYFSYRKFCSEPAKGSYHFSQCTDADQLDQKIKWYREVTSTAKCEEMRQQPHIYLDSTCCYTDRCNNQPQKNIKISDTDIPNQPYTSYNHQGPFSPNQAHQYEGRFAFQPVPSRLPDLEYLPQRHEGHVYQPITSRLPHTHRSSQEYHSRVHHPTTTRYSDTYGSSQAYDKSSSSYSVLSNSFSKWMIFFTLLFCLLVKV
jgi:hypothetical protein